VRGVGGTLADPIEPERLFRRTRGAGPVGEGVATGVTIFVGEAVGVVTWGMANEGTATGRLGGPATGCEGERGSTGVATVGGACWLG